MSENASGLTRRGFLAAAGGAAGGTVLLGTTRASAAGTETSGTGQYAIANGYFSMAGAWGAFTSIAVDPSGAGHYRRPDTFTNAYLGTVDLFTEQRNADVRWEVRGNVLQVTGIRIAGADYSLAQTGNTGAPPIMKPGQVYAQGFTVAADATVTSISMLLATYGADSAGVTATLYAGTAAEPGDAVATKKLTFGDNSTVTFDIGSIGAGQYVLELHDPIGTPSWWTHAGNPTDVGGVATIDGKTLTDENFIFTASGYQGGSTASITAVLAGSNLHLTYDLHADAAIDDPGLSLVTPWKRDGYSVSYDDGVLFSRFYTDSGQLMPAQQLKRRPSWGTFGLGPAERITGTGTGDYNLAIIGPGVQISGVSPINPDSMDLQIPGAAGAASTDVHRRLSLQVTPHTDRLPDTFPAFTASDRAAAASLTTFFHERTFSAQQGATATNGADWKDWTGRLYDWTPGGFRPGERDSLLSIKQDDDGYVWTWNPDGQREWPFPAGDQWDSRHFTTNPCYVLGAWRYYSWTGDQDFLSTMMPRVRKALTYLRSTLGGDSGLVTLPGPDHDGRPGAIGSNYWDICAFGHLDAYTNAYFCGCLEPAAQLEDAAGRPAEAADLRALAAKAAQRFVDTFWDDDAGRFIECIDAAGTRQDYGSAFVNIEAASFGLASPEQARRIYDWLEHGHTELTSNLLLLRGGDAPAASAPAGHSLGQSFTATDPFAQVGLSLAATDPAAADTVTVTLRQNGPDGAVVGQTSAPWHWPAGWLPLTVPTQQPGRYYVELSGPGVAWASGPDYDGGDAYTDGAVDTDMASRAIVVVSPYRDGPADIYSRFGWAPRSTSRKNNFWYFWGWAGVTVPFEQQLQDGGTDLYLSGFDVAARARYFGGDNAWQRLMAVVQRWRDPDHLCGGNPLYRGEHPQNESTPGSVGVDIPFPESGLAPNSFLEAVIGVQAEPSALTVTPRLPRDLDHAGVQRMMWRGRVCDLTVTHDRVVLTADGFRVSRRYQPGETVRIGVPD